jgi:hypothetical protein
MDSGSTKGMGGPPTGEAWRQCGAIVRGKLHGLFFVGFHADALYAIGALEEDAEAAWVKYTQDVQ